MSASAFPCCWQVPLSIYGDGGVADVPPLTKDDLRCGPPPAPTPRRPMHCSCCRGRDDLVADPALVCIASSHANAGAISFRLAFPAHAVALGFRCDRQHTDEWVTSLKASSWRRADCHVLRPLPETQRDRKKSSNDAGGGRRRCARMSGRPGLGSSWRRAARRRSRVCTWACAWTAACAPAVRASKRSPCAQFPICHTAL